MPTQAEIYMAKQAAEIAQRNAAPVSHATQPLNSDDRLMLTALDSDLLRLKSIQSHQKQNQLKDSELLGRYRDYLNGLINDNQPRTELIIFWNMIWAIDAEQIDWAFTLARFATTHDIETPDQFRRDIRNTWCGDISRAALLYQKQKQNTEWMLDVLKEADEWDIIDEIRADIYKASGFVYEQQEQPENAIKYYQMALDLNPRAGVQRAINRLNKMLQEAKANEAED